jgi:hypothetical protein
MESTPWAIQISPWLDGTETKAFVNRLATLCPQIKQLPCEYRPGQYCDHPAQDGIVEHAPTKLGSVFLLVA